MWSHDSNETKNEVKNLYSIQMNKVIIKYQQQQKSNPHRHTHQSQVK